MHELVVNHETTVVVQQNNNYTGCLRSKHEPIGKSTKHSETVEI